MSDTPNPTFPMTEKPSGVLARKYRPETFDGIIAQDTTVRMLQNALRQNRVAQAILFSGVRGTGKTTLARIVAKGLNCLASDAPTAEPCGVCQNCREIAAGNSLDVQEIDAASHTGVDHIRDLINSVGYQAIGRFKVYILDEVHMLSTPAFNALLKTLEEPPAHVRFIFATTENRKIPATVLSRTQRFGLRRVPSSELAEFFGKVIAAEQGSADAGALEVIARAAEGSVRDGLSMLDQFLSSSDGHLSEDFIREQLGQAGSAAVFDLFEALSTGQGAQMLKIWDHENSVGTDPLGLLRDLLGLCHQLSRQKVLSNAESIRNQDRDFSENHHTVLAQWSKELTMGRLARLWQVLLRGADEVKSAPDAAIALEMVLIRAHYLSDTPTPQQILAAQPDDSSAKASPEPPQHSPTAAPQPDETSPPPESESENREEATTTESENPAPEINSLIIRNYPDLVRALEENGEGHLGSILRHEARLYRFAPGVLELYIPRQQQQRLAALPDILMRISGEAWKVTLRDDATDTEASLAQQNEEQRALLLERIKQDKTIEDVTSLFPGAKITRLTSKE